MPTASQYQAEPVNSPVQVITRPPGWRPPLDEAIPAPPVKDRTDFAVAGKSTVVVVLAIGAGAAGQWFAQRQAEQGTRTSNDLINNGLALTVLIYVVVAALIVGFARSSGVTLRWHQGDPVASIRTGVGRGLLTAAIVIGLASLAAHGLHGDDRFTDLLSENNGIRIAIVMLIGIVAAPLVEETLFRGLLLESWRKSGVPAILISGFAFAAWHLNGRAIIYYWLMGIVLGRIYLRRGLVGSMAAHAVFNTAVLAVTIASISGSGHTYHVGAATMHTPPSWHQASTTRTGTGDAILVVGPSGANIGFAARRHGALSATQVAAEAHEQLSQTEARIGGTVRSAGPVVLDLGQGEHATIDARGHTVEIYSVLSEEGEYLVVFDAASSSTAGKQLPEILASIRED
jgi:membrane protease YdiL (CAAX protease family)